MQTPAYKVMDLIPPIRKHTFAPDIDPSNLIDDEAEFFALRGWSKSNYQTVEEEEEPARDEPEASHQQGQEDWTAKRFRYLIFEKTLDLILAHGAM